MQNLNVVYNKFALTGDVEAQRRHRLCLHRGPASAHQCRAVRPRTRGGHFRWVQYNKIKDGAIPSVYSNMAATPVMIKQERYFSAALFCIILPYYILPYAYEEDCN